MTSTVRRAVFAPTLVMGALWCGPATAHGPMPQRVTQTVDVEATPEALWQRVGNFTDAGWLPVVAATKADRGNEPGSIRVIELRDGSRFVETLTRRSEADRSLTYELLEPGSLPVSNYRATLSVKAGIGQLSTVEWTASFMRADRSPRPEAGKTDAAAISAVTELVSAGLAAVRTSVVKP